MHIGLSEAEEEGAMSLRLILALVAAAVLAFSGWLMLDASNAMDIHSVSGDTINEAFYQAFGLFTKAFAVVLFGLATLAVGLGLPHQSVTPATTPAWQTPVATPPATPPLG
jgi:hypothetical protein